MPPHHSRTPPASSLALLLLAVAVCPGAGCTRLGFFADRNPDDAGVNDASAVTDDAAVDGAATADGPTADGGAPRDAHGDGPASDAGVPVWPQIVLGDDLSCAIADGEAWCWGGGVEAEFGGGSTAPKQVMTNVHAAAGGLRADDTGAIGSHICLVVGPSGQVFCAGTNRANALGTNQPPSFELPGRASYEAVPGVAGATSVTAGSAFSCALIGSSSVLCWGRNNAGQLGRGTAGDPGGVGTVIGLPSPVLSVSAGQDHVCALAGSPTSVYCWGSNESRQLGIATGSGQIWQPNKVPGLDGAHAVVASVGYSCAIDATSQARCWGSNADGHLGLATSGGVVSTPTPVAALAGATVTRLAASRTFACASGPSLGLTCWGQDDFGQRSQRPTAIDGWPGPFAVGGWHACVPQTSRVLRCWGANWAHQTGGPSLNNEPTSTTVTF